MAIIPIQNQAINLLPPQIDACNTADGKLYCALFNSGDPLIFQFKQTPCGDDLICKPANTPVTITNGDFATDLSGWTVVGSHVEWNSGAAFYNNASSGDGLSQDISAVAGTVYQITFTISNYVSGYFQIVLGGNMYDGLFSANGTYTINLACGGTDGVLILQSDSNPRFPISSFYLDDVSVSTLSLDCLTESDGWTTNDDVGFTHVVANTNNLSFTFDNPSLPNFYIQINFRVQNRTAGNVNLTSTDLVSGSIIKIAAENGSYSGYATFNGNSFSFSPSTDFDGEVIIDSVYLLRSDYDAYIFDFDGNEPTYSTSIINERDYVTISINIEGISDNCYHIYVYDPCADFTGIELNNDVPFNNPSNWTILQGLTGTLLNDPGVSPSGGTMVISGGKATLTTDSSGGNAALIYQTFDYGFTGTKTFRVKIAFQTGTWQSGASYGLVNFYIPSTGTAVNFGNGFNSVNIEPNTTYSLDSIIAITNTVGSTIVSGIDMYNKFGIIITSLDPDDSLVNELLSANVQIQDITNEDAGLLKSNCISVATSHDCTKLISASCDQNANKLGFLWTNDFLLNQRLRVLQFNPEYPLDAEDYEPSDGSREGIFSKSEKYKTAQFDYMGETEHDTVRAQMLCKTFLIDGKPYYVKRDTYKPEWDKDGKQNVAQSRLTVREKTSTIYG